MSERWQYSRCDDGAMMIHTEGDVIAFVDQNKGAPEDELVARLIVDAVNALSGDGAGVKELDAYDAGSLGDGGGGDVSWWHDYMRAELDRAHEFYNDQLSALSAAPKALQPVSAVEDAAKKIELWFFRDMSVCQRLRLFSLFGFPVHELSNHGVQSIALRRVVSMLSTASPPQPVSVVGGWHDGAPGKPWADEWFIAETTYGDRVVLASLPEGWSYDFKTADDAYIKADRIKRWMQFPDSQYIPPATDRRDAPEPVLFVSEQQLASCIGTYLPTRKHREGNFQFPLYASQPSDAELVRMLKEALEPFAKAADVKLCGEWRDDERFGQTDVSFYLTFGDLRRARAALSAKEGE
ncbi:hypothetical protein [Rhizobium phage RHph_X2_25]|nr:hypothetical protein [Rhizobium phage RHph_X2_25]